MRRSLVPLALAGLFAASPAHAAKELGLNVHQSSTVGMDVAKGAGTTWVRIDLNWLDVEKTKGQLDWTVIDAVVNAATARNRKVLAVIGYGPAWASQGDVMNDGPNNDVPVAGAYETFVTAVVKRYAGTVTHFELWNEPNLSNFWEGTANDYVTRILVPGANAVHAACPSCTVLAPGIATVGGQYDVWLDTVLTAAKDQIDIVSGHAYSSFLEVDPEAGTAKDSFFNKLESHRVLKVGGSVIYEGPKSFREVMDAHGVTKPFWITETGYEAKLGDVKAEDKQVTHYRRVLESMLTRAWWTNTIFYEAFDEPPAPYLWGVVVHDGAGPMGFTPKPVYAFLQKVTSSQTQFGGTGADCDDGLDNDGDGKIDFPADGDCPSSKGVSEGVPVAGAGGGGGSSGSSGSGGSSGGGGGGSGGSSGGGGGGSGGGSGGSGGSSGSGGGSSGDGDGGGSSGGCGLSRGGRVGASGLVVAALGVAALRRRRRALGSARRFRL